jgi:hypothetical protein
MTTQRSRHYDHLEFLLGTGQGVRRAITAMRSMTRVPMEASGTQEVPLPSNPMQRGRARYKLLSHIYAPARSRHKMVQSTANYEQKLAEADATGFVWVHPRGQIGRAADSEWYAFMHGLLAEIRERLEALNKRLSFLLRAIDPVEPPRVLAENDARRERQRPPAYIPRILKQLTDTVVIAPGAPARA